jgi:hypothetical protein
MDEIEQNGVDIQNDEQLLQEAETIQEEPPKKEYTPEQKLARVERLRSKYMKELGIEPKSEPVKKAGELDKADYAYFAAKGYDNDEDIEFLQSKMSKWDMNAREILKDEDVIKKLAANKIERDVRAATPGSMKRTSSGTIDNVDYWTAKYEQTGELPDNFELRSAVINAKVDRMNPNKPAWR